ncbi:glycosyltransferase involved in cell wall biosynthesis [Streptomonospora nanhaiensis]|uniref:Glycosyltransferase involved in cell wall biosynthesis n=3 Tax=Streptomonospora nanhaiensis TaxID=1323731 RepID=A0A853BRJ7_9ACTN|nr:glycosyltransferase family 4 protein [Streptomonospora nanhaiensis]NYI96972.1 glycosyltransferase involved in cell wall biosynthesis [Streptomonospora nanhaiensis]
MVPAFPDSLHVLTYDVRGTLADGTAKPARQTGLVEHTHHLLRGIADRHPATRLALTQTGAARPGPQGTLLVPEGLAAPLWGIASALPQYLRDPVTGAKCPHRVHHYFEATITDPANPVWRSLAQQYADAVHAAAIPILLAQNINPLVGVLKAEEWGLLGGLGEVAVTGVIHDAEGTQSRFAYLAQRIAQGRRLELIAVSDSIRRALVAAGVPGWAVRTVLNGLDTRRFEQRLDLARRGRVFDRVRARNGLPPGRVVLVSARRVPWKGHADVIEAARLLNDRGQLDNAVVVFNGAGMVDTRTPHYSRDLAAMIARSGLQGRVVLLDELDAEEVASCYTGADIAVLPSRAPEPFGYANVEAMLAGVPVVSTAHGGPAEYIDHGVSGLLVPPRDPAALAQALHRLLTDDRARARIGAAGPRPRPPTLPRSHVRRLQRRYRPQRGRAHGGRERITMSRNYILGVNAGCTVYHDPAACLVDEDGRVLAHVEEERVNRRRHSTGVRAPALGSVC